MSGNTGVRLRGSITGGGELANIFLSGRIRDLSVMLLKCLWPPIMAPKTRAWVYDNVSAGRVTDGEFQVNLPIDAMARAQRDRRLPDKLMPAQFCMSDVTTRYFRNLPPLQEASGEASLTDNDFQTAGRRRGDRTAVRQAWQDHRRHHDRQGHPGQGDHRRFRLQRLGPRPERDRVHQPSRSAADQAVGLRCHEAFGRHRGQGLQVPFLKNAPKERVKFSATAKLTDATIRGALPRVHMTDRVLDVEVGGGSIAASGPVKINGVPVKSTGSAPPDPAPNSRRHRGRV